VIFDMKSVYSEIRRMTIPGMKDCPNDQTVGYWEAYGKIVARLKVQILPMEVAMTIKMGINKTEFDMKTSLPQIRTMSIPGMRDSHREGKDTTVIGYYNAYHAIVLKLNRTLGSMHVGIKGEIIKHF